MSPPDTIMIDGHAYSWRMLYDLRRQQVIAWKAGHPRQLALFVPVEDARPAKERTAACRYCEPSLFDWGT